MVREEARLFMNTPFESESNGKKIAPPEAQWQAKIQMCTGPVSITKLTS
jgi:hypothetical protein